jgi:hypothetical protein
MLEARRDERLYHQLLELDAHRSTIRYRTRAPLISEDPLPQWSVADFEHGVTWEQSSLARRPQGGDE